MNNCLCCSMHQWVRMGTRWSVGLQIHGDGNEGLFSDGMNGSSQLLGFHGFEKVHNPFTTDTLRLSDLTLRTTRSGELRLVFWSWVSKGILHQPQAGHVGSSTAEIRNSKQLTTRPSLMHWHHCGWATGHYKICSLPTWAKDLRILNHAEKSACFAVWNEGTLESREDEGTLVQSGTSICL